jgi:DNA primase
VDRELERAELGSAEGKDQAIGALRPVFATLPPSAMREELVRLVADRTNIAPSLVSDWLAGARTGAEAPGAPRGGGETGTDETPFAPRTRVALDAATRRERAFLAQCIALPSAGAEALAATDVDRAFTSDLHRRAAAHVREHLASPASDLPDGDDELAALIAELTVRARTQEGSPAALEAERLKLELGQVEREMAAARAGGTGDVAALATRRSALKEAVDRAIDRVMGEAPVRT